MALYAIGDLHLSLNGDKPMDVFGGVWKGYIEKLQEGFGVVRPEDTTVLLGDTSWALDLQQAREDFAFLAAIPGRKLLVKGNHDYWWTTATKFYQFCAENAFENLFLLHNNCFFYEDTALCGTRGWFFEEEKHTEHDGKILQRELQRLKTSLLAAGERRKLCFLHYPPRYHGYCCQELVALLREYRVSDCYYGHLHGQSHSLAVQGEADSLFYHMVSADWLHFKPLKIID